MLMEHLLRLVFESGFELAAAAALVHPAATSGLPDLEPVLLKGHG
jgi:hypothetical protein